MTLAEIDRAVKSKIRVQKIQAQEQAYYDYTLANLITKGVGKMMGDKSDYPTLAEAYPHLFEEALKAQESKVAEQKQILSALRFKQYADFHNKKI